MPNPDGIRFLHMRDAAALAIRLCRDRHREELGTDATLLLSLTRCLEIVGEAASRISADTRLRHPEIPFARMVAMRNRLIHAYFDIDQNVLWTTVTEDLPGVIPSINAAIATIEDQDS